MSTFCSDAGSQIIFFSTIFFSISNAHRSSNENMVSLHQTPDCSEEEVTPPPKGYVIDLYTHLVMTASSRIPPRSHLILSTLQNAWPSAHYITLFIFSNRRNVHHAYFNESM